MIMTTVNYNRMAFILTMLNYIMLGCVHARPYHEDGIESDLVPQVAATRATTKKSLDDGFPVIDNTFFNKEAETMWYSCKFPWCVSLDEETGSARVSCRSFTNVTQKRVFKVWVEPYCYDAIVTDVKSGTKVMVRDGFTREDALRDATKVLVNWLISTGQMTESTSCYVPAYSSPLVLIQGSCPPGEGIKCDTVCEFACKGASYTLAGNPTIKCKPNTTLSDVFPRCRAKEQPTPRITTTTKTASTTKHVPQTTTGSPPSTTQNSPSTKRMNSSTTENAFSTGNPATTQIPPKTENPLTTEGSWTTESHTTKKNLTPKIGTTTPRSHSTPKTVPSTPALPQTSRTFRKFGFIGFLGVPLLLLPLIYYIYKLRHRHDRQKYRVLDENTVEDDIVDVPPDVDGLYKDMHIYPALPTDQQLNREECYPMDQRNKGLVFILNNYRFGPDRTTERTGSDVDLANVKHVFTEIGYTADEAQNLTAQGIRQKLKSLTRKILPSHTSVVLVFMSHGKEAGIQGYFSLRSKQNGSWFIQALCEELIASAHDHHLDDIMTKVTDRVKRQEGYMFYQRRRQLTLQTPQIIKQGIGKKIFFLPKYPPQEGSR